MIFPTKHATTSIKANSCNHHGACLTKNVLHLAKVGLKLYKCKPRVEYLYAAAKWSALTISTTKWSRVQETILKSLMMPNECSKGVWSFDVLEGLLVLLPILYTWTAIPCASLYWFLVWPVGFLLILSIHIHSVVVPRCPIQFVGGIRTSKCVLQPVTRPRKANSCYKMVLWYLLQLS